MSAAFNRPRVRIALAPAVLSLAAGHYGQRLFMEMRNKFESSTPSFKVFMTALYETFGFKDKRDRAAAAEMKELEDCVQGFLCM